MSEEQKQQKEIISEREFSMKYIVYNDGTFALKDLKTTIGDIELIGVLTVVLTVFQKKYSSNSEPIKTA